MILCLLLIVGVSSLPESFRVLVNLNGKVVKEDITLDLEKKTMIVNVGDVKHLGPTWHQTINLHDFNLARLAIKNVDDGICFITRMEENLAEISGRLHNMTNQVFATNPPHHSYEVNAHSLKRADVVRYAGTKIANFCQGYKTIYAHRLANGVMPKHTNRMATEFRFVCGCSSHEMVAAPAFVFCIIYQAVPFLFLVPQNIKKFRDRFLQFPDRSRPEPEFKTDWEMMPDFG